MTVLAGPDVEGCVKDYLKADTTVTATACGTRIFLAVGQTPTFPYVRVVQISASEDASDAPIDQGILQIDVFGRVGQLDEANTIRRAIRESLARLNRTNYTVSGKGRLLGSAVRDDRRLPLSDQQDKVAYAGQDAIGERPRYIITVGVTCIAVDV